MTLIVADTGPGLPPALRVTAFDRFTRGDVPAPGHSMGRVPVRGIALRHGARIDLPATGTGLAVSVRFPRLPAA